MKLSFFILFCLNTIILPVFCAQHLVFMTMEAFAAQAARLERCKNDTEIPLQTLKPQQKNETEKKSHSQEKEKTKSLNLPAQ
jgi:hypothetical protein